MAVHSALEEKAIAEYHDIQIAVLNLFFFLAVLSAYVSYSQWANGENHYGRGEIFLVGLRSSFFLSSLLTQKSYFGGFLSNLKMVFFRKMHFFAYPIFPQNTPFLPQLARFGLKSQKT